MAASVTTGPGPAGAKWRFGPVGGHGGGAIRSAISPAFHTSCIQSSAVKNLPETFTEVPGAPELDESTTEGGLSAVGVGQRTWADAGATGVALAGQVATTPILGLRPRVPARNA